MVTPIGLGGAHLGRTGPKPDDFDDQQAVDTIFEALRLGITNIDTAPMYGESRRRIGLALKQLPVEGIRREDIILSSKTGRNADGSFNYSREATLRTVDESLQLLNTDYIDTLLVHDPDDLGPVLGPSGTLDALLGLKEQCIIRAIGLGVRSHEFHRECMATGAFDVVLTFCDYNLINQSAVAGVIEPAVEHDVGVYNAAAVMLGLLGGDDPRTSASRLGGFANPERLGRSVRVWEWCREHGVDLLAANLQFCARETRIASTLVGAASPEEIRRDVMALREPIDETVFETLPTIAADR
jgi:aryl-alcohol dehydrogenase-like predicted oxidoreductase